MLTSSFSWSQMVTDALGVITSIISFIKDEPLLIVLVGIFIVVPVIFGIVNIFRR